MILYLVQHGEAKSEAEDPERSLTEAGAAVVEQMADWAARTGLVADRIGHSGKRRAEQTASILAKRLKPIQGVAAIGGLNPGDDVRATARSLQSDQGRVMLVGHLPHLGRLASLLLLGDPEWGIVRFRNAGIVRLSSQEGKWGLDWAITPDLLQVDA
jgi:phosphohistidine phosphatase